MKTTFMVALLALILSASSVFAVSKGSLLLVRNGGVYLSTDNGVSLKKIVGGKNMTQACWLDKSSFAFLQGNGNGAKFGIMNLSGKITKNFSIKNVVAIGTNPAKGLIGFLKMETGEEKFQVYLAVIKADGGRVFTKKVHEDEADYNEGCVPWMHFSPDGKLVSFGINSTDVGPVSRIEAVGRNGKVPNYDTFNQKQGQFLTRDIAWSPRGEMYFAAQKMDDMVVKGYGVFQAKGNKKLSSLEQPRLIEPTAGGDIYTIADNYENINAPSADLYLYVSETKKTRKLLKNVTFVSFLE